MDKTNIVILSVIAKDKNRVEITTNEGKCYLADLSEFVRVHCFPKTKHEWQDVSITANGFNLTWGTRFEVNVLQVVDAAERVTDTKYRA